MCELQYFTSEFLPKHVHITTIDSASALRQCRAQLMQLRPSLKPRIALDMEWYQDALCLLQLSVANPSDHAEQDAESPNIIRVYILDCLALKPAAVKLAVAPILSNPSFVKLTFDCREDCQMAKRNLDIDISGTFDLQLLERLTRKEEIVRRVLNVSSLRRLYEEFSDQMAPYCAAKKLQQFAQKPDDECGSEFFKRPLSQSAVAYASGDVAGLFTLEDCLRTRPLFSADCVSAVRRGSVAYEYAGLIIPPAYRRNNFLPHGVLPSLDPQDVILQHFCPSCRREVSPAPNKQCYVCRRHDNVQKKMQELHDSEKAKLDQESMVSPEENDESLDERYFFFPHMSCNDNDTV